MAHDRRDPRFRAGEWWEPNAGFHPSREMPDPRMGNERWFTGQRQQHSGYSSPRGGHFGARAGWGEPDWYPQSTSDEAREQGAWRAPEEDDRFAWGGGHAPGYGRQSERGLERMADDGWRAEGSAGSDRVWHERSSLGSPYREPEGGRGDARGHASWGGSHLAETWGTRGGQFSGRGPKGYKRSAERIREDVCERLSAHPDIDASEIEVKVEDNEVLLGGTVGSRREKRLAEDCCEGIPGVEDVRNELRVHRHGSRTEDADLHAADSLLPQMSERGRSHGGRPSMHISTPDLS